MREKYILALVCSSIFFGCSVDQKEPEPEPECKVIVDGQIIIDKQHDIEWHDTYQIYLDITNVGDLTLFNVSIPYKVNFKDGSFEEGTVIGYAFLAPGERDDFVQGYISGADIQPCYKFFEGEITSMELEEPTCLCQH